MSAYRSTKDIAKTVRESLKKELPGWTFSVRTDHTSIDVALMSGPVPVQEDSASWDTGYAQLNHYTLLLHTHEEQEGRCNGAKLTPQGWEVLAKAAEILSREHWDKSDIQTDYFHCNFYRNIAIGKWDKPYQVKGGK